MATSAFKSTTKRTTIGKSPNATQDSLSSNRSSAHRRSRSLSRFSRSLQEGDYSDEVPARTGRFVNTLRGSGFPEISLDDLAIEFFDSPGDRVQTAARSDDVSPSNGGVASHRRGRSVSRQSSRVGGGSSDGRRASFCANSAGGKSGKMVSDNNSRRKRSVSVVRYQISDSESDLDHPQNLSNRANPKSFSSGNNQMTLSHKPAALNQKQGLRRSLSQKDLRFHDDYSSQSSALTDDEGRDAHSSKNGIEKIIRAVYAQKKAEHPTGDDVNSGLYEAMRKELRHAVEEIRVELKQAIVKTKTSDLASGDGVQSNASDVLQAVSTIRRNYATKLEQSEKRKHDLLAEIVLEEQRGRELSKIVKEFLPDPNNTVVEKPQTRKRSKDRSRMSKRLTEEAEKYIEDFISNVEDTDISSLDGERSDTSSSLGGIMKTEIFRSPAMSKSLPVEMDGVVLPWLQWETTTETSPLSCTNRTVATIAPKTNLWDAAQETTTTQDPSNCSTSSRGSWSPGVVDGSSMNIGEDTESKFGEPESCKSKFLSDGTKRLEFDVDEYLKRQSNEDFLLERWRQQNRISAGGLLLCNHMFR